MAMDKCVSHLLSCCLTCNKAAAAVENRSSPSPPCHSQFAAKSPWPQQSSPHPVKHSAAFRLLKPQIWATKGRNGLLGWLSEGTVTCCCFFPVAVPASVACQTADSHHGHTLGSICHNVVLPIVPSLHSPGAPAGAGSSARCGISRQWPDHQLW